MKAMTLLAVLILFGVLAAASGVDAAPSCRVQSTMIKMARARTRPGRGNYECANCDAIQSLKTAATPLKPCRKCGGELFRRSPSGQALRQHRLSRREQPDACCVKRGQS